jgi:hypothetical protein
MFNCCLRHRELREIFLDLWNVQMCACVCVCVCVCVREREREREREMLDLWISVVAMDILQEM